MPHIHTEPGQHDHTVSAYIIRDDGDEPRVFLHMHRKQHMLMPVGGHIELNETPWGTLAHELEEESGFRLEDLDVMQPKVRVANDWMDRSIHPQPIVMDTHHVGDGHWHSDASYLLIAHDEPVHQPADGESQDIRWLTEKELRSLGDAATRPFVKAMYLECLQTFMQEWERLPATAFTVEKRKG